MTLRIKPDVILDGTVTVGGEDGVTLTSQPGAIKSLLLDGQLLSAHDALYRYATDMICAGTPIDMDGVTQTGMPRWGLRDGQTDFIKCTFEIPAEWDTVAFRFLWAKETASAGNVDLSFFYHLFYPFAVDNIDTGAVTTVALGSIAVNATQFQPVYQIPAGTSALATPDGALGSKPFMTCGIVRDGVTDTYAGLMSIAAATLTRTS